MRATNRRYLCLFALALMALVTFGSPAEALPRRACFRELADCFVDAARDRSYWFAVWRSLDCEVGWISCVREAVLGR